VSPEAMETEQRCVEELWKASEIALAEKRRQQLALDWIAHHERLQITFYSLAAHHEAKQARYRAILTPPTEKQKTMDKKHEPNPAAGITPRTPLKSIRPWRRCRSLRSDRSGGTGGLRGAHDGPQKQPRGTHGERLRRRARRSIGHFRGAPLSRSGALLSLLLKPPCRLAPSSSSKPTFTHRSPLRKGDHG
jgi:hypothetical protein